MGGGASVQNGDTDPFRVVFVPDSLTYAESQCATDPKFRQCFIDYVKSRVWVEKLAALEDEIHEPASASLWDVYGYNTSVEENDAQKRKLQSSPSFSFQTMSSYSVEAPSRNTSAKVSSLESTGQETSPWPLCSTLDDVRTILLVSVCPIFYTSQEYKRMCFSHLSMGSSSSSNDEQAAQQSNDPAVVVDRSTRLRDLMGAAAAKLDAADLEKYLSNPTPTLVADFRKAISNLPVRIQLLEVDAQQKQAMSLFESSGKTGMLSLSKSFRAAASFKGISAVTPSESSSGKTGSSKRAGLDALAWQDYSAEQRKLVEQALYSHNTLKLAVRVGSGQCSLRALKPITDPIGEVKCMASVEALERVKISLVHSPNYHARQFQQVDDALLLLSALVRME